MPAVTFNVPGSELANVGRITATTAVFAAPTGTSTIGTLSARTRTDPTWVPALKSVGTRTQIRWLSGRETTTGWVPNARIDVVPSGGAYVEIFRGKKTITVHTPATGRDLTEHVLALGDAGGTWPTPTGIFFSQALVSGKPAVYGSSPYVETSARSTWSAAEIISIHGWAGPAGGSSHGCIRLRPTSPVLHALGGLPLGTTIIIHP